MKNGVKRKGETDVSKRLLVAVLVFLVPNQFQHDRKGVDHEIDQQSVPEQFVSVIKAPGDAGGQKQINHDKSN